MLPSPNLLLWEQNETVPIYDSLSSLQEGWNTDMINMIMKEDKLVQGHPVNFMAK